MSGRVCYGLNGDFDNDFIARVQNSSLGNLVVKHLTGRRSAHVKVSDVSVAAADIGSGGNAAVHFDLSLCRSGAGFGYDELSHDDLAFEWNENACHVGSALVEIDSDRIVIIDLFHDRQGDSVILKHFKSPLLYLAAPFSRRRRLNIFFSDCALPGYELVTRTTLAS
jgi:hypothetical protein